MAFRYFIFTVAFLWLTVTMTDAGFRFRSWCEYRRRSVALCRHLVFCYFNVGWHKVPPSLGLNRVATCCVVTVGLMTSLMIHRGFPTFPACLAAGCARSYNISWKSFQPNIFILCNVYLIVRYTNVLALKQKGRPYLHSSPWQLGRCTLLNHSWVAMCRQTDNPALFSNSGATLSQLSLYRWALSHLQMLSQIPSERSKTTGSFCSRNAPPFSGSGGHHTHQWHKPFSPGLPHWRWIWNKNKTTLLCFTLQGLWCSFVAFTKRISVTDLDCLFEIDES
jgi:hypothetical protein